jgi:LmbE family N-acetylglucosaminyl deacetylase
MINYSKIYLIKNLVIAMKKKRVLVVIAHPDDETIWMGGILLRNKKNWNTTIVCLCRESDKDREPKFKKASKILGVKGDIYDLDDKNLDTNLDQNLILEILKKFRNKYDLIFTHNSNGEYGHIRHKDVHEGVLSALKQRILSSKKILFFSYLKRKNNFQGYAVYNSNADKLIKLNSDELALKKKIMTNIYGYQKNGFEEKSCGEIESFKEMKI